MSFRDTFASLCASREFPLTSHRLRFFDFGNSRGCAQKIKVFRVDPFPGEIPVIPQIVFQPTQVARFGGHCEVRGATGYDELIEEFHAEHPIGINPLYRRTVTPQVLKFENISFDLPNQHG